MTTTNGNTERPSILLVDDNDQVRTTLGAVLEANEFQVTKAASVAEALQIISKHSFDVLLCDLHMPGAGDGFTVVSAMRHTNKNAITLVFTGYPALKEAMQAILLQADEILVKPMGVDELVELIRDKLAKRSTRAQINTERVAAILERDSKSTIKAWLARVRLEPELMAISLSDEKRTGHLPKLLDELVGRLLNQLPLGTKAVSHAAVIHGQVRLTQGYSVPMLIEESRILQVSLFETLQNNLGTVDFSLLLVDVMTIADEVDSQLKQTISSFMKPAQHATEEVAV